MTGGALAEVVSQNAASASVPALVSSSTLLDLLYTSGGVLTHAILGHDLMSWDFSYFGLLTIVMLDGVLPLSISTSRSSAGRN
jgi:hypothetical protein